MSFHLHDIQKKTSEFIRKFGTHLGVDTNQIPTTIWNYGDIESVYNFPSDSGESLFISSSDNSDNQKMTAVLLDENFKEKTVEVQLSGNAKVPIAGTWTRINDLYNSDSTDLSGDVYLYTDSAVVSGIPSDDSAVKSFILSGYNQSAQSVYTVPEGKNFHATGYHISCDSKNSNTTVNATVSFDVRFFGGVFTRKEIIAVSNHAPSVVNLSMPFYLPAKTDIVSTIQKCTNNSVELHSVFEGMLL